MNYFLAYVLFLLILVVGRPVLSTVVGGVLEDYPAASSGILEGDKIIEVNGKAVTDWKGLLMNINENGEQRLEFTIDRDGDVQMISIMPAMKERKDILQEMRLMPTVGLLPSEELIEERYGLGTAIGKAYEEVWRYTSWTYLALWRLVTGRLSPREISGPIRIVALTGDFVELGTVALLQFVALLSISLAVINLMPVPALDGGHFAFLLVEVIFRRPLSVSFQERVTQVGFYMLMGLMVVIVFNDLVNIGVMEKIKSVFFEIKPIES